MSPAGRARKARLPGRGWVGPHRKMWVTVGLVFLF